MQMKKISFYFALGAFIVSVSVLAGEKKQEIPDDEKRSSIINRVGFWLGWFGSAFQSEVQLNSQRLDLGTYIRFERTFDLPDQDATFRAEGYYRFNLHHRVQFGYYDYKRSGRKELDREIHFGDLVIPAGASSDATMNTRLIKGLYRYALFNNGKFESGLSVGLSLFKIEIDLVTQILNQTSRESESLTLPLPVFGFYNSHFLWNRFFLNYHADFFAVKIDIYDGVLIDFTFGLEYYPLNHVGIGLMFNSFQVNVSGNDPGKFDGKVVYLLRGIAGYISLVF